MSRLEHLRRLTEHVEQAGHRALRVEEVQLEAERKLSEAHSSLRALQEELTRPHRVRLPEPAIGDAIVAEQADTRAAVGGGRARFGMGRIALLLVLGIGVSAAALAVADGSLSGHIADRSHAAPTAHAAPGPTAAESDIAASPAVPMPAVGPVATVAMSAASLAELAATQTATAEKPPQATPAQPVNVDDGAHYAKRFAGASAAERECLAQAVYYEARGEPVAGQIAVAQVVLNRTMSPSWPHTICGVVRQGEERGEKCQFSFMCMRRGIVAPRGEMWQQASWVASEVLSGGAWLKELTESTHYHRTDLAPVWRLGLKEIGRIGHHVFYGPPGSTQVLALEVAGDGGASQRGTFATSGDAARSIVKGARTHRPAARRSAEGSGTGEWAGRIVNQ